MNLSPKFKQLPFYVGVGFLFFLIAIELAAVLFLNKGLLVYTLDDPYIHMALAENIRNGHYGINAGEFSAPSSSMLWPFIIAPLVYYEYFPFVLNVIAASATVFFFVKILQISFSMDDGRIQAILISVTIVALILATNLVGLSFTGMEHSLQVLLVVLTAYGLMIESETGKLELWLLAVIIAAPLIRYECMGTSISAIIYLFWRRYFTQALITLALLVLFVGGFSIFLMTLGLGPFPTSIIAKSSVVASGGKFYYFIANLKRSVINQRQGINMSFEALALVLYLFFSQDENRRRLAVIAVFAVSLHFIAGSYSWYNRYEIYIWSFMLLVILYVYGPVIAAFVERRSANLFKAAIAISLPIVLAGIPYLYALFTLPLAANNIYEQQYQMHRFAVDYYKKPIAVNDLGYVSYKNNNYVLDLWGLGSEEAFQYRNGSESNDWLKAICEELDVELAMIYPERFKQIPDEWIKIGILLLGKPRITPAHSKVVFYATDPDASAEIVEKLQPFIQTLPSDVEFQLLIE